MKVVRAESDLLPAVAQARREALAAFGDGTLYLERLVERPRHVEFQILADDHDHVVHLFERECSIQRRHQKVLEETPSPALTPALRRRMGDAAVRLARAAGYRNAGTVEFLVEGATGGAGESARDDARFYFLEMNARLQVEHPITEAVVGVDLVRAQILVASGQPVPWSQDELHQRGHAFEARIYAEDPAHGHLPQAGHLALYREPSGPGIRVDSGVVEGSDVPVHYDPLLAKLVATGETREIARRRAEAALRDFPILGLRTNTSFLLALLRHPRVVDGDTDTTFLDEEGDRLLEGTGAVPPDAVLVAALARHDGQASTPVANGRDPWQDLRNVRV
jgi:acetyl/propionyl-CoA carboxylase alpha subunit